jgi:hypothetical protein
MFTPVPSNGNVYRYMPCVFKCVCYTSQTAILQQQGRKKENKRKRKEEKRKRRKLKNSKEKYIKEKKRE